MEEELIKRLALWAKGKPQGPISVHLDPTNRCNLRCRFCWQRSHERLGWIDREHELSEKKLLEIVRDAAKLGVRYWLISGGGEPFVRLSTTTKVMVEIKKYGITGDIITNGTLLNEKSIRRIVKAKWDIMRFSVNAPDPKIHDFMVDQKGAFERVIKNIKLIKKTKEKMGSDRPIIGFNTVITSKNYKLFPELVDLLHELGGEVLNTQTIILYDTREKIWSLNKRQKKDSIKYLKKAARKCKKYGIRTNLENYLSEEVIEKTTEMDAIVELGKKEVKKVKKSHPFLKVFCYEPFYLVTIRANGIVGSCRLFGDQGDNIHNKTLKEIWFGPYFENARKTLMKGPQHFCSKCGSNEMLEQQRIRDELSKILR
ncbi:MAG: radical SAM protein [Candidatus Aenigmarchaeota archaeon]|nr:radical SAM protein [Candidatus Aenigmarchaeota archaeon]